MKKAAEMQTAAERNGEGDGEGEGDREGGRDGVRKTRSSAARLGPGSQHG